MALMGKAVLAIWHGVAEEAEADFIAWHCREHMQERIGIPGFLRAKRYVAVDGYPKFFNFYETETVDVLSSKTYRDRLDDPTPWTRRMIPHFIDNVRTICSTRISLGSGEGGFIETLRFAASANADSVVETLSGTVVPDVLAAPGIVGIHLLQGHPEESQHGSVEKTIRSQPDRIADWSLLIEAIDAESLTALRAAVLSDTSLGALCEDGSLERGLYRFQFGLSKAELGRGA